MKYKQGNFYEKSKEAFEELKKAHASTSACHLYDVLCFDEHIFTGENEGFFFRSIDALCKDSGMSSKTVMKSIKTLVRLNMIETRQMHWVDENTGKKSEKHITAFRLLD